MRPLVDRLDLHPFVDPKTLAHAVARPTWFLVSLLTYDLWHKLFIDRTLPRPTTPTPSRRTDAALLAPAR
ncbi:MAG: hypothetical protein U0736_26105 [Gemmataceae bacterium]